MELRTKLNKLEKEISNILADKPPIIKIRIFKRDEVTGKPSQTNEIIISPAKSQGATEIVGNCF